MNTRVHSYKIIGTRITVYEALIEDDAKAPYQGSHTFTYDEGKKWIVIGTDPRRKEEWKDLAGEDRVKAVYADYRERGKLAVKLILEKHPELLDKNYKICDSSIEVYE